MLAHPTSRVSRPTPITNTNVAARLSPLAPSSSMLASRPCAAARPLRCPAASISACAAAAAGFRARNESLGGGASPSSSARAAPLSPLSTNQCTQQQQRTNLAGGLACPSSGRISNAKQNTTSIIPRSFLGVGAPEAVLVGVVALVVFGPKGLAEAARSVGQALRAFQPTIREVVEVSQDLKGTLEKEFGLDEIRSAASSTTAAAAAAQRAAQQAVLGGAGSDEAASTSSSSSKPAPAPVAAPEEEDPDIEAKRAESARLAWGDAAPPAAAPAAAPAVPAAAVAAAGSLADMSVEELEAELARRRAASGGGAGGGSSA